MFATFVAPQLDAALDKADRRWLGSRVRVGDGCLRADEATYELQLRWLTLQPDVQLVMMRDRSVGVAGARATVVF